MSPAAAGVEQSVRRSFAHAQIWFFLLIHPFSSCLRQDKTQVIVSCLQTCNLRYTKATGARCVPSYLSPLIEIASRAQPLIFTTRLRLRYLTLPYYSPRTPSLPTYLYCSLGIPLLSYRTFYLHRLFSNNLRTYIPTLGCELPSIDPALSFLKLQQDEL